MSKYKYEITGTRKIGGRRFRTIVGEFRTKREARQWVESYKRAPPSQYKVYNPRIRKIR